MTDLRSTHEKGRPRRSRSRPCAGLPKLQAVAGRSLANQPSSLRRPITPSAARPNSTIIGGAGTGVGSPPVEPPLVPPLDELLLDELDELDELLVELVMFPLVPPVVPLVDMPLVPPLEDELDDEELDELLLDDPPELLLPLVE